MELKKKKALENWRSDQEQENVAQKKQTFKEKQQVTFKSGLLKNANEIEDHTYCIFKDN